MSPTRTHRSSSVVSKKDKKACEYCFRRKMKCDLQDPCANCVKANKECVAAARVTKPRPTHEHIERLQRRVNELESHLTTLSRQQPDAVTEALQTWQSSGNILAQEAQAGAEKDREAGHTGSNSAHGKSFDELLTFESPMGGQYIYDRSGRIAAHDPTSALFDNEDQRDFGSLDTSTSRQVSETALKEQATAKAAEERHMEILNLASNKLEFDGVSPDLAMYLLALHWNRQHFAFLISYRPLFTRDMANGGPYFSRLLLNAIYFSVSKFSNRVEVYDDPAVQTTAGNRFLRRVKQLLGEALDQSSIPTIQAMLLLSSSMFALGHQSAAWLYHGIAIQMIFDLGLNYDVAPRGGAGQLSPDEYEIRRRIVWAAFTYDKIISLYQGRPVSFDESRMRVPHRFLDWYEEQELWTPYAFKGIHQYPGAPARAISTFTSYCSLSVVMGRIITQIYAEKSLPSRQASRLTRLSTSLDDWKKSIPSEIEFDPFTTGNIAPPPHVLSLHMVYHTLVILLHRPFVETGASSDPQTVSLCWSRCEEAAKGTTALLERYRAAFSLGRAPYLISYATYVAATIHVRIAAQRTRQSEANHLLHACIEGLGENTATNPGVMKMYQSISGLMTKLGVTFGDAQTTPSLEVPNEQQSQLQGSLDSDLDLDAIIRSFGSTADFDPTLMQPEGVAAANAWPTDWPVTQDSIYGFLGFNWAADPSHPAGS